MSPDEYDRLARLVADPPKGSKLAEARDFGIDLTLLLSNLQLTPTERLQRLMAAQLMVLELRRGMRRAKSKE